MNTLFLKSSVTKCSFIEEQNDETEVNKPKNQLKSPVFNRLSSGTFYGSSISDLFYFTFVSTTMWGVFSPLTNVAVRSFAKNAFCSKLNNVNNPFLAVSVPLNNVRFVIVM